MSDRKILVIGAGLIGVTTAYELVARGEDVELIDTREGVALEASFANGAMLTASMPEPWNGPGVHKHLIASLFDARSPMKLHVSALPSLLSWGIRFLYNSSEELHWAAARANYALASYSIRSTRDLRERLQLPYAAFTVGTMKVFRHGPAMERPTAFARMLAHDGLRYRVLDRDAATEVEPQLAPVRDAIAGALYFPDDEGGDAHLFCRQLADRFVAAGGQLRTGARVERIVTGRGQVAGAETTQGRIETRRVVVAAGHQTPDLLRALGLYLPIQPVKGYSVTIDLPGLAERSPRIPVIDDAAHAAVVPVGSRLRCAGIAEFAGTDRTIDGRRIDGLFNLMTRLYPRITEGVDRRSARPWTGLRPISSDGVPFVGPTRIPGLYVNAGHGHLGWTLAVGSARLLADMLQDSPTAIDPHSYRATR